MICYITPCVKIKRRESGLEFEGRKGLSLGGVKFYEILVRWNALQGQ